MAAGVQVASLFGVLGLDDGDWNRKLNKADKKAQGFGGRIDSMAGKARTLAGEIAMVFGPLALGLGVAVKRAVDFDEAMANTAAVLGLTREEQSLLAKDILAIGMTARAGPQRVAEAYYDIVGGVADVASHMDILNAAIATSEAGNADLGGVTKALIATMNGFGLKTKQATRASDVLTRTVGVGVGTMDELATVLPDVAGLAHSLGIELEDTGALLGFLSTKGNTFNQSATQMRQMMVALLNPNEKMKKVFEELGIASGQAAIEQFGLAGAFQQMQRESPTFVTNMAGVLGSVEALNGVTAVLGEDAVGFLANFTNGLEGATAAAQDIQNASPAAMWDMFMSKVNGVAIVLGQALLPVLGQVMDELSPIVQGVADWIGKNPKLIGGIGLLALGAALLSPLLIGISTGLEAIKLAIGPVGKLAFGLFGVALIVDGFNTESLEKIAFGIGAITIAALAAWGPIGLLAGVISALLVGIAELEKHTAFMTRGWEAWTQDIPRELRKLSQNLGLSPKDGEFAGTAYESLLHTGAAFNPADVVQLNPITVQPPVNIEPVFLTDPVSTEGSFRTLLLDTVGSLNLPVDTWFTVQPFLSNLGNVVDTIRNLLTSSPISATVNALINVNPVVSGLASAAQGIAGFFSNFPGFSDGGWTGGGPRNQVAGLVHSGEYVIPSAGAPILRERGSKSSRPEMMFGPNSVVIYTNDEAGGRRAADGFDKRLRELRRARGLT
jgi:TP901 family phage tail tape measure protein